MFFDKSCLGTIKEAGYNINPFYIVDSKNELLSKIAQDNSALDKQYLIECTSMAIKEKDQTLELIVNFLMGL